MAHPLYSWRKFDQYVRSPSVIWGVSPDASYGNYASVFPAFIKRLRILVAGLENGTCGHHVIAPLNLNFVACDNSRLSCDLLSMYSRGLVTKG